MANLGVTCTCGAIYEVIESKGSSKDQRPSKCVLCDREVFPPDKKMLVNCASSGVLTRIESGPSRHMRNGSDSGKRMRVSCDSEVMMFGC
jgi:hypothetical protein